MAKTNGNGKRYTVAIITLIVLLATIASSGITRFVTSQHETKDTAKDIGELKVEGCLPARDNEKAIIRVEGKIDILSTEQKASEKRILEAIRHESP